MHYGAITIDCQTVMENGFDLDGKLLAQLKQFVGGPTAVVVSEVVVSEILKHLKEKTRDAKDAIESAHRRAVLFGLRGKEEKAFAEQVDPDKIAERRLSDYLESIGAIVVTADSVSVRELWERYSRGDAPFAISGKKKAEFPDAIALLSLEHWAEKAGTKIIAASGDGDWAKYGKTSKGIHVVGDLATALETVQANLETAEALVESALLEIRTYKRLDLQRQFEEWLGREIENYPAYATAESSYSLEGEEATLTFKSFNFRDEPPEYTVVQISDRKIVARVELTVTADASASFAVSVYDTVDKDYVDMGYTDAEVEDEELELEALVTFEGDFATGDYAVTEIELLGEGHEVDFGTVEPDWGGEDYEFGPAPEGEEERDSAGNVLEPWEPIGLAEPEQT
jgi:hypothetical protein